MLRRVRQIIAAMTAEISSADTKFLDERLTSFEKEIFYAMNLPDQRHVLNVAYTAIKLAKTYKCIDEELLIKGALLHDVGKVRGDVSTVDKVIAVLVDKFVPQLAKRWIKRGHGGKIANLRHALFIYYNHPALGAIILKRIGEPERLIDIVKKHHLSSAEGDSIELLLLRQADDLH